MRGERSSQASNWGNSRRPLPQRSIALATGSRPPCTPETQWCEPLSTPQQGFSAALQGVLCLVKRVKVKVLMGTAGFEL